MGGPDTGGRDRDPTGRARNARPRDAAGRPLARDAAGVARIPEELVLPPAEALAEAERLFASGLPFHAHEVLEGVWKSAPGAERELWRGLAQIAVGLTHVQRGNPTGAVRLLRRGAERVSAYAEAPPHGVDAARVVAEATHLAALVEQLDLVGQWEPDALPPGSTALRLTVSR